MRQSVHNGANKKSQQPSSGAADEKAASSRFHASQLADLKIQDRRTNTESSSSRRDLSKREQKRAKGDTLQRLAKV